MRGASIRTRLVVGMVLLVSIGLAIANVSGTLLLRAYLNDRVDAQMSASPPGAGAPPRSGAPHVNAPVQQPTRPSGHTQ